MVNSDPGILQNKKAKLAMDAALAGEMLQSCREKCIADFTKNSVLRDEKYHARWTVMFEEQRGQYRSHKDQCCGEEEEGGLDTLECRHVHDG
jgi:hypothetical protein